MKPVAGETGASPNDYRGPQGTNVCTTEALPSACDDGPFGKGKGGQLRYEVTVPAGALEDPLGRGRGLRQGARGG